MVDAPPLKPWGKADNHHLKKLIDMGKVDITNSADAAYINQVRFDHFCHRNGHNFRRNFHSYTRSQELEDHLSSYH